MLEDKMHYMHYLVCQIGSRQYLVKPDNTFEVDKLSGIKDKNFSSERVLLWVEDDKMEIGMPYLKRKVEFEYLEDIRKPKIRVAKYSPKSVSNRRVIGQIREVSRLKLRAAK